MTVVLPTFRRPALLRRAIQSVQAQSWRHLRICVYDNASEDETRDTVLSLSREDPRIIYHCHDRNLGMAANYNFGLSRVETAYFSFLGDDDILLPGFFEAAVSALERDREARFFCGRTVLVDRIANVLQVRSRSWIPGAYRPTFENVIHMIDDPFTNTAILFRAEVLKSVGVLDDFGSDWNYVILAAASHPFVVSDREFGLFTLHAGSFSGGAAIDPITGSLDVSYIRALFRSLYERLLGVMQLSAEQRDQLEKKIGTQAARGVLHVYLFMRSFPAEQGRGRDVILDTEMELMPTRYHRLALRVVRLLGVSRLTARITTATLSLILKWRIKLCALTGSSGFRTLRTDDPLLDRVDLT